MPVKCNLCGREFKDKSGLNRHCPPGSSQCVNQNKKLKQFLKCRDCNRSFKQNEELKNHIKQSHSDKFDCLMCGKKFTQRCDYLFHLSSVHSMKPKSNEIEVSCPKCMIKCASNTELVKHIEEDHQIEVHQECYNFDSFDNFLIWKQAIEEDDNKYIKIPGIMQKKGTKTHIFNCKKSGIFVLGKTKKGVSVLPRGHCPAQIKVLEDTSGQCQVSFITTHLGHDDVSSSSNSDSEDVKENYSPFEQQKKNLKLKYLDFLNSISTEDLLNVSEDMLFNLKVIANNNCFKSVKIEKK